MSYCCCGPFLFCTTENSVALTAVPHSLRVVSAPLDLQSPTAGALLVNYFVYHTHKVPMCRFSRRLPKYLALSLVQSNRSGGAPVLYCTLIAHCCCGCAVPGCAAAASAVLAIQQSISKYFRSTFYRVSILGADYRSSSAVVADGIR